MKSDDRHSKRPHDATPTVLARVRRLTREPRNRRRHRRFFIEGVRNFVAAVECGFAIEEVIVSPILLTSTVCRRLVRNLDGAGTRIVRILPEEFRGISVAERASGIAAVVRQRVRRICDVDPHEGNCWIVLSRIRSPGNLGSLVRTAAAAGAAGFILLGPDIDPFDPSIVRASMGAFFRQIFVRTTAAELAEWVVTHGLQVIGASPEGTLPYNSLHYRRPAILVLGEERRGLDAELRGLCQQLVHIPMFNRVDSLNVSVAGSLLLYEVYRHAK